MPEGYLCPICHCPPSDKIEFKDHVKNLETNDKYVFECNHWRLAKCGGTIAVPKCEVPMGKIDTGAIKMKIVIDDCST